MDNPKTIGFLKPLHHVMVAYLQIYNHHGKYFAFSIPPHPFSLNLSVPFHPQQIKYVYKGQDKKYQHLARCPHNKICSRPFRLNIRDILNDTHTPTHLQKEKKKIPPQTKREIKAGVVHKTIVTFVSRNI